MAWFRAPYSHAGELSDCADRFLALPHNHSKHASFDYPRPKTSGDTIQTYLDTALARYGR